MKHKNDYKTTIESIANVAHNGLITHKKAQRLMDKAGVGVSKKEIAGINEHLKKKGLVARLRLSRILW
jgi:hypothetical protein